MRILSSVFRSLFPVRVPTSTGSRLFDIPDIDLKYRINTGFIHIKPIDITVEKHRIKEVRKNEIPINYKEFGEVKKTPEPLAKVVIGVFFFIGRFTLAGPWR